MNAISGRVAFDATFLEANSSTPGFECLGVPGTPPKIFLHYAVTNFAGSVTVGTGPNAPSYTFGGAGSSGSLVIGTNNTWCAEFPTHFFYLAAGPFELIGEGMHGTILRTAAGTLAQTLDELQAVAFGHVGTSTDFLGTHLKLCRRASRT